MVLKDRDVVTDPEGRPWQIMSGRISDRRMGLAAFRTENGRFIESFEVDDTKAPPWLKELAAE